MADGQLSGARARAVFNYPSASGRMSAAMARVATSGATMAGRVSDLRARVLIKGRVDNKKVRAWGFHLDAHDFYVLRLGQTQTIVVDLTTGQASVWKSPDSDVLFAHRGINWRGLDAAQAQGGAGSNVVAGSDRSGMLWFLDPDSIEDSHPYFDTESAFTRVIVGGVTLRGREAVQCNAISIASDPAFTDALTSASLRISDDQGRSWKDMGTVDTTGDSQDGVIEWRALGQIRAPGRVFELTDTGALKRVNGLDLR